MSHLNDSFDNAADRAMAKLSEGYRYSGYRFPEPPPPTCIECDEEIDPDDYDDPMPSECARCRGEDTRSFYRDPDTGKVCW